jgi:hypothetical protein
MVRKPVKMIGRKDDGNEKEVTMEDFGAITVIWGTEGGGDGS